MASQQAQIRSAFRDQLDKLREYVQAEEQSLCNQQPSKFYEPDKGSWNGDLFDIEGMAEAFKRDEIHDDFRKAINDDGVTTDLEVCLLQGDFVAMLERAYRERHKTPVRAKLHAAARRRGHGDEDGLYTKGLLGYLEHLMRLGAG